MKILGFFEYKSEPLGCSVNLFTRNFSKAEKQKTCQNGKKTARAAGRFFLTIVLSMKKACLFVLIVVSSSAIGITWSYKHVLGLGINGI